MISILLLAAGASRRMRGGDKLLEKIDGLPLLSVLAQHALAAACGPVHVTLPPRSDPKHSARRKALAGYNVHLVSVDMAQEGMAASIRAGVSALSRDCTAVMIVPADMPELNKEDFGRMALQAGNAGDHAILRAFSIDTPGHPVVFPKAYFEELKNLRGDLGARPVIAAHHEDVVPVALPQGHAITDLDTPEAWNDWRRARSLPR